MEWTEFQREIIDFVVNAWSSISSSGGVSTVSGARWWDLVPSVVGAVVGAAAAAIPAWWLARSAALDAREAAQKEEQRTRKSATLSALWKLTTIANGIASLRRHIHAALSVANDRGHLNMPRWQVIQPIAGLSDDRIRFLPDEVLVFILAGDSDFATNLFLIAQRYSAMIEGFMRYGEIRRELSLRLAEFATASDGVIGEATVPPEQSHKFRLFSAECEALFTSLYESLQIDYDLALSLSREFGIKARKYLADTTFPLADLRK